jgi:hypothetical protein
MSLHVFDWPGEPPPMVDGEMAWFVENQWHIRHADGTVEDFPDLLAERWAAYRGLIFPAGHQGSENP